MIVLVGWREGHPADKKEPVQWCNLSPKMRRRESRVWTIWPRFTWNVAVEPEWVSSFLTAHQHIIGHSVPLCWTGSGVCRCLWLADWAGRSWLSAGRGPSRCCARHSVVSAWGRHHRKRLGRLYHQDLADSRGRTAEKSGGAGRRLGGTSATCWTCCVASHRTQHTAQWWSVILL